MRSVKPKVVPTLKLDTDWKRCRFEAAEQRKDLRLQEVQQPLAVFSKKPSQC